MRNAGAMRWLPYTSAGLPRRYAPRNDKGRILLFGGGVPDEGGGALVEDVEDGSGLDGFSLSDGAFVGGRLDHLHFADEEVLGGVVLQNAPFLAGLVGGSAFDDDMPPAIGLENGFPGVGDDAG